MNNLKSDFHFACIKYWILMNFEWSTASFSNSKQLWLILRSVYTFYTSHDGILNIRDSTSAISYTFVSFTLSVCCERLFDISFLPTILCTQIHEHQSNPRHLWNIHVFQLHIGLLSSCKCNRIVHSQFFN